MHRMNTRYYKDNVLKRHVMPLFIYHQYPLKYNIGRHISKGTQQQDIRQLEATLLREAYFLQMFHGV